MRGTRRGDDVLPLSVHGPVGVLDLQVPAGASCSDVAIEYSRQADLRVVPRLYTRVGVALDPAATLADAGLLSGTVLVALDPAAVVPGRRVGEGEGRRARGRLAPGPLPTLWCTVAGLAAVLAALAALTLPGSEDLRAACVAVLFGAAALGALPVGPLAAHRVPTVPVFAGAATLVLVWDPLPERLPTVIGFACLGAAVAAAAATALGRAGEEALRVWIIGGVGLFVVTALAALAAVPAQAVWSLLLLGAMLAARFVPLLAVEMPDRYLLDVERLAVSAWSARERPARRRGRVVVPVAAVCEVAARGARMVTAACVAVLVVAAVSAALLLAGAGSDVPGPDRIGARCQVGLAGAALLLAARSFRHPAARALLRYAGLACWGALLVVVLTDLDAGLLTLLAGASIGLGVLLVAVAVALGRGWRSVWWARQADVAEAVCGALAVGSVVAATGLFTALWRIAG